DRLISIAEAMAARHPTPGSPTIGETHMPFKKGQSGNPAGRPVGARNRRTIAMEKLFGEDADAMAQLAIELAKKGQRDALCLCLDLIWPRAKARRVVCELSPAAKPADAAATMDGFRQALAGGELSAHEAVALSEQVAKKV